MRSLLTDRRQPGRAAARQQLRHARVPLVREGDRAHDRLQPRQGRDRDRAQAFRWRRPACRGRRQPRQHVLGRRAPLLGDDERDQGPAALGGQGVLRLLRRSLRVHPHHRALPLGRAARAEGGSPAAKGAARSTSTAAGSTHGCGGRSPWSCATSTSPRCSATSSRASRSSTRLSSVTTRSPTIPGSSSPMPSRSCASTTPSSRGWSGRSSRPPGRTTSSFFQTTARLRAGRSGSATDRPSRRWSRRR